MSHRSSIYNLSQQGKIKEKGQKRKNQGNPSDVPWILALVPPKGSDLGLKDDQENSFGDTYAESRLTCASETLANSSPLACCEADTGEHER